MSSYSLPKWQKVAPHWTDELLQFLVSSEGKTVKNISLNKFEAKSEQFPIPFPISTARCKSIRENQKVSSSILERNINSAYPLVTEDTLFLYANFLSYKRKHGSIVEQKLYKNMNLEQFIDRLLTKRAVMFMGKYDSYILIDGTKGRGKWEIIGTDKETTGLNLQKCISYDEIKLSALLSVSSYSYFINDGKRKNFAKLALNRNNLQDEGIIIGIIGARMKRVGAMEYQEIVITKKQNTKENGYGKGPSLHSIMADFYQTPCFTYGEVSKIADKEPGRFFKIQESYFDNLVYSRRNSISIDTLLIEANSRAKERKSCAYVHVVGIGLGVWRISTHQDHVFGDTFIQRITALGEYLPNVSDIHFSYFTTTTMGGFKDQQKISIKNHPKGGITIYISKREPHTKLTGQHSDKLLVISYAWDGNALPGNEFWDGKLGSSGDSAAASSTQISEIHNPHINPLICGANLRIATLEGVLTLYQYREKLRSPRKRKSSEEAGPS